MTDNDRRPAMEGMEALWRGQKGDKGAQGDPGAGMTAGARRAILYLFALTVLLAGANLFWSSYEVNANQAAQRREGMLVEQKLCSTLGQLAALKPPTRADVKKGAPYPPSFTYEDQLHATLAQLGADIGCQPRSTP